MVSNFGNPPKKVHNKLKAVGLKNSQYVCSPAFCILLFDPQKYNYFCSTWLQRIQFRSRKYQVFLFDISTKFPGFGSNEFGGVLGTKLVYFYPISQIIFRRILRESEKNWIPPIQFCSGEVFLENSLQSIYAGFSRDDIFLIRSVILESGFSSHPPSRVPSTQNSQGEIKLKLPGQDFNHLFWNTVCIPSTITQHFPSDNFYYQNNLDISFPSSFLYLNDFYASFRRPVIKAIPTRRPPLCDPKPPHWGGVALPRNTH